MAGMLGTAMMTNLDFSQGGTVYISEHQTLATSDESEPSWLEPELELKDFQLGSWPLSLQLEIENWTKTSRNFDF